jgi:hypothetical protein
MPAEHNASRTEMKRSNDFDRRRNTHQAITINGLECINRDQFTRATDVFPNAERPGKGWSSKIEQLKTPEGDVGIETEI